MFLTNAMEVSHFAPIVRALMEMDQDVSFISPQLGPKATQWGWDDADRTELLLKQMDLPWTKKPDFNADCVLTIQSANFVPEYKHIKMRMTYGVGLIPPVDIKPDPTPFDYHLVHGPFNQRVQFRYHALSSPMLPADRVKVIGYPRFDDWFANYENRLQPRPGFNVGPAVLLWLPTWGRSSSIHRYADAIFALSDKYDIWVKPHHGTVHWERDRMTLLAEGPCRIVDYTDPPEPSFAAASIVLADLSSGAFSEAVFLNKKVVGLTNAEEVDKLLFPDVAAAIPLCMKPNHIASFITGAMIANSAWLTTIRAELVDSTEGADGPRAAQIITEILQ